MAEQRTYYAPGVDLRDLAAIISRWFQARDFRAQVLNSAGGGFVIQARQPESWKSFLGLTNALTVTLTPKGSDLVVETGAGLWVDKVAAGAVGIIFHPLLITAAYGAWRQSQLPEKIFNMIGDYISDRYGPGTALAATSSRKVAVTGNEESALSASQWRCPSCGQATGDGAKFCEQCGTKLPEGEVTRPSSRITVE